MSVVEILQQHRVHGGTLSYCRHASMPNRDADAIQRLVPQLDAQTGALPDLAVGPHLHRGQFLPPRPAPCLPPPPGRHRRTKTHGACARLREQTPSRPSTTSRRHRRPSSMASGSAAMTICAGISAILSPNPAGPVTRPLLRVFAMTALMALAAPAFSDNGYALHGHGGGVVHFLLHARAALLKLRDVERFSSHVPQLRPAGAALGALWHYLSVRRRDGGR